ncbi:hypothetical protein [Microbulbifer discodermiae]|uniref:hypothetical protein n=1 Tax=Microbulbifer sp. 2201CG32-9 TaxID=3232309 RepID=UPI00345BA11B
MQFIIELDGQMNLGELSYIRKESSLAFEPYDGRHGCSTLIINDIELVVGDENTVLFTEGYFPEQFWVKSKLNIPESKPGKLSVDRKFFSAKENEGMSIRLTQPAEWEVTHDPFSGWICIGDKFAVGNKVIEYCSRQKVVLSEEGELLSLWIKPHIKMDV